MRSCLQSPSPAGCLYNPTSKNNILRKHIIYFEFCKWISLFFFLRSWSFILCNEFFQTWWRDKSHRLTWYNKNHLLFSIYTAEILIMIMKKQSGEEFTDSWTKGAIIVDRKKGPVIFIFLNQGNLFAGEVWVWADKMCGLDGCLYIYLHDFRWGFVCARVCLCVCACVCAAYYLQQKSISLENQWE